MVGDELYYEGADWSGSAFLDSPYERTRLEATVAMLPNGVRSLLDVGCGNGAFLSLVEHVRPEVHLQGIDRATSAVAEALCAAPVECGSIDRIEAADRSVDVVSCLQVLEHIPRGAYEEGIAELARVAGTHLLVSVPYRERRDYVLCPSCGCLFNPYRHLRSFDTSTLVAAFPDFQLQVHRLLPGPDTWPAAVRRLGGRLLPGRMQANARCPQCDFTMEQMVERSGECRTSRPRLARCRPFWLIALLSRR